MCGKVPVISSGFLCFLVGGQREKVSLPGPTGEANFADLMSFLSVPTGNPHAPGKVLRLQKEPEKEAQWGQFFPEKGCKHPLEVMMQRASLNAL